jgi:exosome complex component RRP41
MYKRPDKRDYGELRKIEAKAGIIKRADGSAYFKIGDTVAYAAVYGPRNLYPKFLQNPQKGILRCNYNMMPFSGSGERVRPGGSRRSKEISLVIKKALLPVLDLNEFPNSVVDVFIEFPQTDAGSRCAGVCAAAIALADAGLSMKDLVSSVAVGIIEDNIIVDVSKEEEDYEKGMADIPLAFLPRTGKISLLQMDGIADKEQLKKVIELGKIACKKIYQIQKKTLKEKYKAELK